MLKSVTAIALAIGFALPAFAHVSSDIEHVLRRDGFSMNLAERSDGRGHHVNVRNLGTIRTASASYEIMFYSNEDQRPSGHGNYALLVFVQHPGRFRYVGAYSVSATALRIRGKSIYFDSPCELGCKITFGEGGPPGRAWINGENPTLVK